MRTLKFRIWNKKTGKFISSTLPQKFHLLPELYDVQQFTGLTDRHGKEIYEGDIIRFGHGDYEPAQVEFDDGAFNWVGHNDSDILNLYHYRVKVIGNIYENPELVK